jgi:DNA-binding CsgD family transcriptional regulator
MERETLEAWLEEGLSLEQIGRRTDRHPSTVAYWLEKHGLEPAHRARHAPRGGIPRETLEALVARHLTIREIAAEVGMSQGTVRYWLRRHRLRTTREARLRARREAPPAERFVGICERHGETRFVIRSDGPSRCERCRVEAVSKRRRHVKALLVAEAGGRCALCGYDRYVGALEFHHVDPSQKSFGLGRAGVARSLDRAREEARKCVLLCSNCHAEVEGGVARVPS